jgi:hypothetical protein
MLFGAWTWTRAKNHCTEVYDFRLRGEYRGSSGEEVTQGTYDVAYSPDANGYYKLTMAVAKDYGGVDCYDSGADNTGETGVTYVKWAYHKEEFWICHDANGRGCFGPLRRASDSKPVSNFVRAGSTTPIANFYNINADCMPRGEYAVRIGLAPRHGRVEIVRGTTFPNFPDSDIRHLCDLHSVPTVQAIYTPNAGYVGSDMVIFESITSDGGLRGILNRITVLSNQDKPEASTR